MLEQAEEEAKAFEQATRDCEKQVHTCELQTGQLRANLENSKRKLKETKEKLVKYTHVCVLVDIKVIGSLYVFIACSMTKLGSERHNLDNQIRKMELTLKSLQMKDEELSRQLGIGQNEDAMKRQKGLYRYPQPENIMCHIEFTEPMTITKNISSANSNKIKCSGHTGHKPSTKHTGVQIVNRKEQTWSCCNRAKDSYGCSDDSSVQAKDALVSFPEDAYKPHKMHQLYNHLKTCVYQERHDNQVLPQSNNKGYRDIPDPFNLKGNGTKKVVYMAGRLTYSDSIHDPNAVVKHLHHHGIPDEHPDLYHDLPEHLGGPPPKAHHKQHHALITGSGLDQSIASQGKEHNNVKSTQVMSKSKLRLLQLSQSIKTLNQSTLVDDDPYELLTDTMFENHVDLRHTFNNTNITNIARTSIAAPHSLVAALSSEMKVPYNTIEPKTIMYSHVEAGNSIQKPPLVSSTQAKAAKRPQSSTGHVNGTRNRRPSSALPSTKNMSKSLTQLPQQVPLVRPKSGHIGQLRESKIKGIDIHRKQGRPLTAQSGPHLYTTTTITPAQCIDSMTARIV